MTNCFKCKLCGGIEDWDNYPPSQKLLYWNLKRDEICYVCSIKLWQESQPNADVEPFDGELSEEDIQRYIEEYTEVNQHRDYEWER